jgi:hypothetical protein
MAKDSDYMTSFNKLIAHTFTQYRGILLEHHNGGWRWMGQVYYSKEDLDRAMDERGKMLENSLNKIKSNVSKKESNAS